MILQHKHTKLAFKWSVIALMISVTAFAGLILLRSTSTDCFHPYSNTRMDLSRLNVDIEMYKIMNAQTLPGNLNELDRLKDQKHPTDPWDNKYYYFIVNSKTYLLFSAGPDGQPLTDDDIHGTHNQ